MPDNRPLVVVVGAGYTGNRILQSLPPGHSLGLSRSPLDSSAYNSQLLDLDHHSEQPIVLSCPYSVVYTVPPDSRGDMRLSSFLSRLAETPNRVVYLSTSGVYGDRQGDTTYETDPVNPTAERAERRVDAEQLLGQWCAEKGAELVVLRVSGIYGPGRLGLDRLQNGAEVLADAESGPANRIHVDDLVSACIAASAETAPPGIYNIADGDHRSGSWFSRTVARLSSLPAPAEISLADANRTWSEARLSFLNESRRLDTQKMRTVLGVTPRFSNAEDGIRASLGANANEPVI